MRGRSSGGESNEELADALRAAHPVFYRVKSGFKDHARVRCPWCGDSQKSRSSAHLFVRLDPPHAFKCQRCELTGYLGRTVLEELGVSDPRVMVSVARGSRGRSDSAPRVVALPPSRRTGLAPDPPEEHRGLEYANGRLEVSWSSLEWRDKCRAVFGTHGLELPANHGLRAGALSEIGDSIGFLSADGSCVVYRSSSERGYAFMGGRRYYVLDLTGEGTHDKTLIFPGRAPVLGRAQVALAEGPLDLAGVLASGWAPEGALLASAAGKAVGRALYALTRAGVAEADVHVYADSDVAEDDHSGWLLRNPFFGGHKFWIWYNRAEKDWGVPARLIDPVRRRLLAPKEENWKSNGSRGKARPR